MEGHVRQQYNQLMLTLSAERHLLGRLRVNRAVPNGQVQHGHQESQTLEFSRGALEDLLGGDHAAVGHEVVDALGDGLGTCSRR